MFTAFTSIMQHVAQLVHIKKEPQDKQYSKEESPAEEESFEKEKSPQQEHSQVEEAQLLSLQSDEVCFCNVY